MTNSWIPGLAIALAAVTGATDAGAQRTVGERAKLPATRHDPPIHQEVDFEASPARLYEALLDSRQFSEFSRLQAEIDRAVGGTFTLFEASIVGRNVELIPNRRIVQAWRVADWPAGVYSTVKFELTPQGTGTHLVFDQTAIPEGARAELVDGWEANYWHPLKYYLLPPTLAR